MEINYIVIYAFMGFALFLFTWPPSDTNGADKLSYFTRLSIAILVFSFLMGCRYEVGLDYMGTLDVYKSRMAGHQEYYLDYYEPLFYLLTTFLADLGVHFSFYFGIIAFLQITLLVIGLRKYPKVLPFIFLFFILECIWFAWANIMRHGLAQSFFILAISFFAQKKYLYFLIFITLGIMSHNSTVLMFPLILIYFRKDFYCKNIPLQLALFFLALGLFLIQWEGVLHWMIPLVRFMPGSRYSRYLLQDERLQGVESFGFGFAVLCLINFILIVYSNKVKAFYNDRFVNILYDLFFVGTLFEYLCLANMLIGRINVFFIENRFILCGFYFYYLLHVIPRPVTPSQITKSAPAEDFTFGQEKLIPSNDPFVEKPRAPYLWATILLLANLAIFVGYLSKGNDPDSTFIYHFFWEFE